MLTLSPAQLEALGQELYANKPGVALGPLLLGTITDICLLGIALMLFVRFQFRVTAHEKRHTRILVYSVMCFAVIISVFNVSYTFHVFVYNFGKYGPFVSNTWSSWEYILNLTIRLPVASFFATRAWRILNRSIIFAVFVISSFIISIACVIASKVIIRDWSKLQVARYIIIAKLANEVASDLVITTCIAGWLLRSRTGWNHTDRLLRRLLIMVAETQLPPTISLVTFLIAFIVQNPETLTSFFDCDNKINLICLLVVLNTQHSLRRDLEKPMVGSMVVHSDQKMPREHGDISLEAQNLSVELASYSRYTSVPGVGEEVKAADVSEADLHEADQVTV